MMDAKCNNLDQLPVPENNPTPAAGDPTPTPNLDPSSIKSSSRTDKNRNWQPDGIHQNIQWNQLRLVCTRFMNTRVRDMIKNRPPTHTSRNHITVTCVMLKDFFSTSTFEIDLRTGKVFTFQTLPEDIAVSCQQQEFNLDLLRKWFQDNPVIEHGMEEFKRIPSIRKIAPAADIMDLAEAEEKVYQLCTLWELYVDALYELARKSKLPPAEAAKACKIYRPYISDILQKVDAVITIFAMGNELRILKGRGHFRIPKITPQGITIDSKHQAKKTLDAVNRELTEILKSIRESEEKYEKEQEEAKLREQQARVNKPVQRHEYNYLSPNSSTPIKNADTRTANQNRQTEGVHFNPNTVQHYYSMTGTTSHMAHYKPPVNDSIIQAASTAHDQPNHGNRS